MNTIPVKVVRFYLLENKKNTQKIMHYLKETANIRGATLIRGIAGYGEDSEENAGLIGISFELPVIIEFFDEESKVNAALDYLTTITKPQHLLTWQAQANS